MAARRKHPQTQTSLRYVALGDSYTIGTATRTEGERWPNQLVERVREAGAQRELHLVANLGVNGFTSRDVIDVQLPRLDQLRPDVISLLVGVNDVVRGVPALTYAANVNLILDALVGRVGGDRVFAVTTPDYTVTPQGAAYGDPGARSAAIAEFNDIISGAARARGVAVVDIRDISLEAAEDPSLVAGDGLHPSSAQYARWVERIAPVVGDLLTRR